jgi:4'-phosphopantetheinyl transferase
MNIDFLTDSHLSASIAPGELHLWVIRDQPLANDSVLVNYHEMLSGEETLKQKGFYFEKHRLQYLVTRAFVRNVLSRYDRSVKPRDWAFTTNKYGRPFIANFVQGKPLFFSLSHTENFIALLVSFEKIAGVDVEWMGREVKAVELAGRYFSSLEVRDLLLLSTEDRIARFFDLWTLKEAYIKARGMGLSIPLDSFSYFFKSEGEVGISFSHSDDDPKNWKIWEFLPDQDYRLSIALKSRYENISYTIHTNQIVQGRFIESRDLPLLRCVKETVF